MELRPSLLVIGLFSGLVALLDWLAYRHLTRHIREYSKEDQRIMGVDASFPPNLKYIIGMALIFLALAAIAYVL